MSRVTCKDRLPEHYKGRITDLRELWHADSHPREECRVCKGTGKIGPYGCEYCEEGRYSEDGHLNEYGLAFDYVAPGTFGDQRRGYWRYQLGWGGPSDEFRFYCDEGRRPVRVEYWFLDWFDGAHRTLRAGKDFDLLMNLWSWFDDVGAVEHSYAQAAADA